MRHLQSKQLTSNKFVNKCLLSGVGLDDCVEGSASRFSRILKDEYFSQRLTDSECYNICVDHFDVMHTCCEYSDYTQLVLSVFDICNEQLARNGSFNTQRSLASRAECLDILLHSEFEEVRAIVAKHSYRLDVLMHDDSSHVKCAVARSQYALNQLIKDQRDDT